jgi:hypothetical protein
MIPIYGIIKVMGIKPAGSRKKFGTFFMAEITTPEEILEYDTERNT